MTKGKKKKKKDRKRDKGQASGLFAPKAAKRLRAISANPLVADVVAATLIGAASALRDSKNAHKLAANVGNELEALTRRSARSGNALWQLALDVGRKSLEALAGENDAKSAKPKAKAAKRRAPRPSAGRAAGAATKSRKSTAKPSRSPAKRRSTKPVTG